MSDYSLVTVPVVNTGLKKMPLLLCVIYRADKSGPYSHAWWTPFSSNIFHRFLKSATLVLHKNPDKKPTGIHASAQF